MGTYTTNNYFYKPSLGASGQAEKDKFDNALDSADAQIEQNEYGGQTLTVSDSTSPSSDSGTLKNLLGFLANRLKAITGKSDWKTSPKRTLEATGTISEQDYNSINITGGSIAGITDLAVADGGTGASTASTARSNLGLGTAAIESDTKYAHRTNNLSDLGSASTARTNLGLGNVPNEDATDPANWDPANTDDNFLVGDGTTFVVESGATARTSLGLGSISTQDASSVAITGGDIDIDTIDFNSEYDNGTASSNTNIDWSNGNNQKITLGADIALTFSNIGVGHKQLKVVQDATGNRTPTLPAGKWEGGTSDSFSAGANAEDILSIYYDGSSYYYQLAHGWA